MQPDREDERFVALLVADQESNEAEAAIADAGGRVRARLNWDEVADELPRRCGRAVLVLEAGGVEPDRLADALPRIDSVAAAMDLPVVATLDAAGLDLGVGLLATARTELLFEPSLADRVAALAIASVPSQRLRERVREDEGAKLRQLNDEVARIADVLARLAARDDRRDDPPSLVAEGRPVFEVEPDDETAIDPAEVRRAIRSRRLRAQFFAAHLLEDPGWDMLLDLFAAELEQARVSVSSLCIAAAVAPTTALRWIGKMTGAGLLAREADPFDRRRAYMVLTPRASQGMRAYVSAVRRAGLEIA